MSIIVFLVCLMFLGAIVKVAWGAIKLVVVVVFTAPMVHSCHRSDAQPLTDDVEGFKERWFDCVDSKKGRLN